MEVAVAWLAAHWLLHAQLGAVGQRRDGVVQWLLKVIAGWVKEGYSLERGRGMRRRREGGEG